MIKHQSYFKNLFIQKLSKLDAHNKNHALIYRVSTETLKTYVPNKGELIPLELTQIVDNLIKYNLNNLELLEFKALIDKQNKGGINSSEKVKFKEYQNRISFNFDLPSRSISYGNSLFAGVFHDHGASPFWFFEEREGAFYALKINKFAYGKRTEPLNNVRLLFSIPPLSTLCSLFAEGEFFHPRSRSYYFLGSNLKIIKGVETLRVQFFDNINYFVVPGNPIEMNAKLSDYIANNATVFWPKGQDGMKLLEGQKNITALFKIMDFIYKNKANLLSRSNKDKKV